MMRTENSRIDTKRFDQIRPVGLTGGIASGKTTVAAMFRSLGAITINADIVSSAVLGPETPALKQLVDHFGPDILTETRQLDRKAMLDILIYKSDTFHEQIDILRPHILPAIDHVSRKAIDSSPGKVVIVEAPLLFEYGRPERYHPVIVVSIPRSMQIERLAKRSGKPELWAGRVVDLQWPMPKKEQLADYVIHNDRSVNYTRSQVKAIYKKLIACFSV